MKINKFNALRLWDMLYGEESLIDDFHGYLMCRDGYGNQDFYILDHGERIYCGWNLHHVLPRALGGTSAINNLICTNIATNIAAADRITFWIDDCLYQVRRTPSGHGIFLLN